MSIDNTLPISFFAKPGERVVWFSNYQKIEGNLIGYDIDERPIIINQFDVPDLTGSFDIIRPKNPNNRINPNWDRMPSTGKIFKADPEFITAINRKLSERIPPGPSYMELINEFYYRGYETYLVGGTVRDFLQGVKSNDIDLVTTIPLKFASPLIKSMFGRFSYKKERGYIRIGGTPASGDPFIDIKNFNACNSYNGNVLFGSEIENDSKIRDFACNAIYYDPINCNLIDPFGIGVEEAKAKKLSIVKDLNINSPHFASAQIIVRLVKFVARGYECPIATLEQIRSDFIPLFSTMTTDSRMRYIRSQIINKERVKEAQKQAYDLFVEKMIEIGLENEYVIYIQPHERLLNLN
jgi:hypothetical protein